MKLAGVLGYKRAGKGACRYLLLLIFVYGTIICRSLSMGGYIVDFLGDELPFCVGIAIFIFIQVAIGVIK